METVAKLPIMASRRLPKTGRCESSPVGRLRNATNYVPTYSIYFILVDGLGFSEGAGRRGNCYFSGDGLLLEGRGERFAEQSSHCRDQDCCTLLNTSFVYKSDMRGHKTIVVGP